MPWTAFTKFKRYKELDFQHETELRLDPENVIGTIVMINPGKIRNPNRYNELTITPKGNTFAYAISIIEEAYKLAEWPVPCGSLVEICNLFDLADSNLTRALGALDSIPRKISRYSIQRIPKNSPWVWLAWGSEGKHESLKRLMADTLLDIPPERIIGVKIPNETYGYYHPLYIKRTAYRYPNLKEELMVQIAKQVKKINPAGANTQAG